MSNDQPLSPLLVSADQGRKLLNISEVVDQLEKFSTDEKKALGILIGDHAILHSMVQNKEFWTNIRKKFKWFIVQIAALLTAIATINEVIGNYLKWRGLK